jgi:tetratricopeptide (TPR) repeat protein
MTEPLEALECFKAALAHFRQMGERWMEAAVLQELAAVCLQIREPAGALTCYRDALGIYESLGASPFVLAQIRTGLGDSYLRLERWEDARGEFALAQKQANSVEDRIGAGRADRGLAMVDAAHGRFAQAKDLLESALQIARDCDDAQGEREALAVLESLTQRQP